MTVRSGPSTADRRRADAASTTGVSVEAFAALARLVADLERRDADKGRQIDALKRVGIDRDRRNAVLEQENAELKRQVGTLELRVAALERQDDDSRHSTANADRDAIFIRALLAVGDREFSAAEVLAHARTDMTLRAVLDGDGIRNAKQVGKRLASVADRDIVDGIRLTCFGENRDGMIWRILRI